jgi:beta-glucosidase
MIHAVKSEAKEDKTIADRVSELMSRMGLDEKIGQMSQLQGSGGWISDHLTWSLKNSRVGSVINEVDVNVVNELQRLCVEESRLVIPLLIGLDVIQGFKTIFSIIFSQT